MAAISPLQSPPSSARASLESTSVTSPMVDDSRRLHFSLNIMQKLDEKNFHLWCQQVELYINARDLTDLVVCARVPSKFVNDAARRAGSVNPA